jgi:hypothetical protein
LMPVPLPPQGIACKAAAARPFLAGGLLRQRASATLRAGVRERGWSPDHRRCRDHLERYGRGNPRVAGTKAWRCSGCTTSGFRGQIRRADTRRAP